MGNGPDLPGEWGSSGPGEPPAQLLRRAISHVESLLHRLEGPTDAADDGPPPATASPGEPDDEPVPVASIVELTRTSPFRHENVAEDDADGYADDYGDDYRDGYAADDEGTRLDAGYIPLAGVSSAAQAEALRITLHAHEEAHRLTAEANSMRAEAAAEGERILVEARMLCDRLHVESRETATELLTAARVEADAIVEAARTQALRIQAEALETAAAARAALDARAEQERCDAREAVLAEARREAEHIRAETMEAARAEAARRVEAELAAAVAEGRNVVEASRARARELVDAATSGVDGVRTSMRQVIGALGESLAAFDSSVECVRTVRDTVAEAPAPEPVVDDPIDERRPLGLLFGARRG